MTAAGAGFPTDSAQPFFRIPTGSTFAAAMKGLLHTAILRKVLLNAVFAVLSALVPGVLAAQEHQTSQDTVAHDVAVHAEAGHEHAAEGGGAEAHVEEFKAGELIMEHIGDAHSWHLWGHTSLSLPVILWTDKGMEFFSSGKLMDEHHHAKPYTGAHYTYLLQHEKIKVLNADSSVNVDAKVTDFSLTKSAVLHRPPRPLAV